MVVDSSAIFAILFKEPERERFLDAILNAAEAAIGAPTLLECRIVALRRAGAEWNRKLALLLEKLGLQVIPFDAEHERIATHAFEVYGKGTGRGGLNYGDCLCYAIARRRNDALLYKGEDFARTDLSSAL
ncbi:MAG TPA: type II toxin-antitoxin system VapC family toxin [Rhizomicrobium sp.]|jgi:ribonuclease VapC